MRRTRLAWIGIALIGAVAVAGCAKKADQASTESTNDSLVASNPTERAAGDITPQTAYQEPPKAEAPPPSPPPRRTTKPPAQTTRQTPPAPPAQPALMMAAGTAIKIDVTAEISSENAQPGDTWNGTVKDNVIVGDRVLIPAGSSVTGTVRGSKPAVKGDRAMLLLGVSSVNVNGKDFHVSGSTDSIIAGSTRARNLGAVAGGTAAGALIGKAVGGSGKGAVIGALIGAAATGAAVSTTKGYQVVLKPGTELTFTTDEPVAFSR